MSTWAGLRSSEVVRGQDIFLNNFQKSRNSHVFKINTVHILTNTLRFPEPVFTAAYGQIFFAKNVNFMVSEMEYFSEHLLEHFLEHFWEHFGEHFWEHLLPKI